LRPLPHLRFHAPHAHLASASGPLKSYLEYRWVKTSNDDPNVIYSPL